MTAEAGSHARCCGLTDEEAAKVNKFLPELAIRTAVSGVFYPLAHVKTLIQLGYEPFPLSAGKMFAIGRDAYFLPNGLSYARSLVKRFGWVALYRGMDAAMVASAVTGSVNFGTAMYLDRYFPDIGGKPENVDKEESELSDSESARRALRVAIRECTTRTVATIVARPFVVVMVRKVAQIIGGEAKYFNVVSSLYLIGREEGPAGFFSGLVPQLIAEFITVFGVHALVYGIERGICHVQKGQEGQEAEKPTGEGEDMMAPMRKALCMAAPFVVSSISYPFTVVSTVMAVTGSQLAVSMLPYSPPLTAWQDVWEYLKPNQGLKRGARLFYREHVGAIAVGPDEQLYAVNKHFL